MIHLLLPNVPLIAAFALAAVLSPTDAVALLGIVGKGRISKNIQEVLEGEALMNDASGLVALKFAVAVTMGTMEAFMAQPLRFLSLRWAVLPWGSLLPGYMVKGCC